MLARILVAPVTGTVRGIPTELPLDAGDGLPQPCAASFDGESGWTQDFEGEPVPDIESSRDRPGSPYDIVGFDVEPGDAVFFSTLRW